MNYLSLELYNIGLVIAISIVIAVLMIILVNLLKKKNGHIHIRFSLLKILEIDIQFHEDKKHR